MKINLLKERPQLDLESKSGKAYAKFGKLLEELSKRDLSDNIATSINQTIAKINAVDVEGKALWNTIRKEQSRLLKQIEKEMKLVPKGYYRQVWLAVGMAAFGLPLGTVYGLLFKNMAFIGMGLPIGLAIGMAVGDAMDKKAAKEGRQLDIELK